MAFTYDPTTDIGKVRFELGDDTLNQGVKPDGTNLSNEEIQVLLDREGSVMRAVAGACEMLSRRWVTVSNITVGPRQETYAQVAQGFSSRAAELRRQYGGIGGGAISAPLKRVDGYSEAQESEEYGA